MLLILLREQVNTKAWGSARGGLEGWGVWVPRPYREAESRRGRNSEKVGGDELRDSEFWLAYLQKGTF